MAYQRQLNMVGVAQLAERRIVVPDAVGSSPISHPILKMRGRQGAGLLHHRDGGMWCNGNTRDFDSRIVGSSPAVPATTSLPVLSPPALPFGRALRHTDSRSFPKRKPVFVWQNGGRRTRDERYGEHLPTVSAKHTT